VSARNHEGYEENIGAYVLGALPELDAELLERHLAGCETCRAEAEDLRLVIAAMARSVPQVEPPPSLKASLMRTVLEEASLREAAEGRVAGQPVRDERARRGKWLAGLRPRVAIAGLLAVLALGVVIGVAADKIVQDSGTRTIAAQIDRKAMPTGNAALEIASGGRKATLKLTGAPRPAAGKQYQLWVQRGKAIERGPAFTPPRDGTVDEVVPGGVRNADAVMVTVEKAGGAPAPTRPPVMRFPV
jgi:anti-sigma factor RsiW